MVFPLTGIGSISFHYSAQKTITKYEYLIYGIDWNSKHAALCAAHYKNILIAFCCRTIFWVLGCMTLLPSLFFCIQGVLYCRELTSILARHPEIYNPPFANLLQCRFYLQVSFLLECFAIMVTAGALCIFTAVHDHNGVYYTAVIPSQVKFVFMASHF